MASRLLLAALFAVTCATARADLDDAAEAEDRALEAEAEGDVVAAATAWKEALAASVEDDDPESAEWASYVLDRYTDAALQAGRLAEAAEVLAALDLDAWPLVAARRDWNLATILLRLGRTQDAWTRAEALGFLTDWLVCGPFDNQEGQGLSREDGPEGEFAPAATFRGKVRDVGWRPIPALPCLGTVDLDALFRPNDQACAYATTWIRVEAPVQAVARVSSDEGFRLWLDGRLVAERDVRRDASLDQDVVPLPLGAGWHRLVMKVGDLSGSWGFRLRLTDREGRALRLAEVRTSPPEGEMAAAIGWSGHPPSEDLARLRARASTGKATARERYHLACLISARRLQPRDRRDDREQYRAAAEKDDENSHYSFSYALSFRESTSMAAEQEENEVRTRLVELLAAHPEYDPATLELARIEAKTLARGRRATDLVREVLARHPRNLVARVLEIDLLAARGLAPLARRLVDKLAQDFPDQTAALARQTEVLLGEGRVADARVVVERALAIDPMDDNLRNAWMRCLRAQGDLAGLARVCQQSVDAVPLSVDARSVKVGALEAAGKYEEAITECDLALRIAPEASALHETRARLLDRLGRREEALAGWKRALEADPNDARLRRFLEHLSAEQESYEARYRVTFEEALADGKAAPKDPAAHARYLLDELVVRLHPDGTKGQYTHWIVEILDEKSIREFDVMGLPANPGEETLKVLTARVVHPDGRVDEARVPSEFGASIDFPPLAVGDVVDLEYRQEELRQGFFGDYFGIRFFFAAEYPLVRSRMVLLAPATRKLHLHARNGGPEPTIAEGRTPHETAYVWEARNAARVQAEPGMPGLSEVVPAAYVASFPGWKEFGAWYWSMVKGQWDVDEEVRAKVRELTKGIEDPVAQVRAVYNFVSQKVPYQAWEFGVHGFQPYRASQILRRGFGDCKDKATLICVMLGELGIKARPVIIHADAPHGRDDLASPMMEHFNHCIALVTLPDGKELWLDGTATMHPMDTLPEMDRGATVLVVEEDGGRIAEVPWGAAEESRRTVRARVSISADGSAQAVVTVKPIGLEGALDRAIYSAENRRTEAIEQEWGRRFGACRVVDEEFSDLEDVDVPVEYRYRVEIPSYTRKRGEGASFPASPFALSLSKDCPLLARTHDLLLSAPTSSELEVRYALPEGMKPASLPTPLEIDTPVASARASYEVEGNDLVLRRGVSVKAPRVAPAEYAAYRGLCQDLDRWEDQEVVLERMEK